MPPTPAEVRERLREARHAFQKGMLEWLSNDPAGLTGMKRAVAAIESIGSSQGQGSSSDFWRSTVALLGALAEGGIAADSELMRLCARIDVQIRNLQEGSARVAEPLMRDVLRRIALARPRSDAVERVCPAGGIILTKTIYDLYLGEARGHLDTLERELQPGMALPPTAKAILSAHSLGGISDTIGRAPIKDLAFALGRALGRMARLAETPDSAGHALLVQAVRALREMSEAVAEQRLSEAKAPLVAALDGLAQAPVHSAGGGAERLDPSQAE